MTKKTHVERIMEHKPGAVEILCREIGARYEPGMETVGMLLAFVSVLIGQVDEIRHWQQATARLTQKAPSADAVKAISLAQLMVGQADPAMLIERAKAVHDFCHVANPDEAYPTDHLIDMVSSCASAIRFGLEMPCHSRHAAAAASHIWQQKYGMKLSDSISPSWGNDWARIMLQRAMLLQIAQAQSVTAALRKLVDMARTSGGTAGRDEALCDACDQSDAALFHSAPEIDEGGMRDVVQRLAEYDAINGPEAAAHFKRHYPSTIWQMSEDIRYLLSRLSSSPRATVVTEEMVERATEVISGLNPMCEEIRCTFPLSGNCECADAARAALTAALNPPASPEGK